MCAQHLSATRCKLLSFAIEPGTSGSAVTAAVSEAPPVSHYRFDGVVLDPAGHRLRVDGRDRACSRRALSLLELLCQRPGRVWPRSELLDALWPGGQVVADESLSQLVFRLRAALGTYGERVVTVRGVGVRLDAQVEIGDDEAPATATTVADPARAAVQAILEPAPPAQDPPEPIHQASSADSIAKARTQARTAWSTPRSDRPGARPWLIAIATIMLAVVVWVTWTPDARQAPSIEVIDEGYGLRAADLLALQADTPHLLTEALRYDDRNDRERAQALLEAVHDADPGTPVPALLLSLWAGGIGDDERAALWLQRGGERMPTQSPNLYLTLFDRYVRAEVSGSAPDVVRQAGALLDLRPEAWRFRLARAHLYGFMGLRDQALAELQQIQVQRLDHSRQAMALGDRASFGDVEGARRILATLTANPDDANEAFVRGRIDWSAGDLGNARMHVERAADLARRSARLSLRDRALAYAGILALLDNDLEAAIAHLERARAGAFERGIGNLDIDLSLLLAEIQHERGDVEAMRSELRRASDQTERHQGSVVAFATVLVSARLAPDLQPAIQPPAEQPGAIALLDARRALRAGDRSSASAQLDRAIAQGVLDAWLAEEARLLQADLGRTVANGPPLDPPHPPLVRFAIRRRVAQALNETPPQPATD